MREFPPAIMGRPREAGHADALERAARVLVHRVADVLVGSDVALAPSVLVGAEDVDPDDVARALDVLEPPLRVRAGAEVRYAGTRSGALAAVMVLREATGADVLIQRVSGRARGDRHYPTLTGELLTENVYPVSYLDPASGVARVLFGLGDDLAGRRDALRFSPAHPDVMPEFSQPDDVLHNGQRRFSALLAGKRDALECVELPIDEAIADGTLNAVGGVVSLENQVVHPGVYREGVRVVTCAMLLRGHPIALAPALAEAVSCLRAHEPSRSTSLRFALDLPGAGETDRRPELTIEDVAPIPRPNAPPPPPDRDVLVRTRTALGLGAYEDVTDLVYVPPERFDVARTVEMASEVRAAGRWLGKHGRRHVLIIAGRLGSTDRALGLPLRWADVSGAAILVETALEGFNVEQSRGTHFFRDLTFHETAYLHVSLAQPGEHIAWGRLNDLPAAYEGTFVRHVSMTPPPRIWVDGAAATGVIALGAA